MAAIFAFLLGEVRGRIAMLIDERVSERKGRERRNLRERGA